MAENNNHQGRRRENRSGTNSSGRSYKGRSANRYSNNRSDWSGRPSNERSRRSNDRYRTSHDESWDSNRTGHNEKRNNSRFDDKRHQDRRGGNRGLRDTRQYNTRSSHAPRGGKDRDRHAHGSPHNRPVKGPQIPEWVDPSALPGDIRRELHMLSKENADRVASHMIASYGLIDDDPDAALAHAYAARDHAGRIAVVREHAGIIAYLTGHWQEALGELRTARRIGGGPGLLSIMADCERGLGRPERAIDILNSEYTAYLDADGRAELLIVVAGARADLGQHDAAIVVLEQGNLDPTQTGETAARYFYAYADALLAAGRRDEAIPWFRNAASIDEEAVTDAMERLEELES